MANYTIELGTVCEMMAGMTVPGNYLSINQILEAARKELFNFSYPIPTVFKQELEMKILRSYYFRELCDIPIARWRVMLEAKMNEIMPYYNQLYESTLLQFNPLYTTLYERTVTRTHNTDETRSDQRTRNQTETRSGNKNGTESDTSETLTATSANDKGTTSTSQTLTRNDKQSASEQTRMSDTPQGDLTGLEQGKYLTEVQETNRNTTGTQTDATTGTGTTTNQSSAQGNQKTTNNGRRTEQETSNGLTNGTETGTQEAGIHTLEDVTESIQGYQGKSASELVEEFRRTLLNIDQMILADLNVLFFGIY